ncbi:DNA repair protein RadA [Periweissella fabaria]|uniref:DNA repair protein RadA n=1 Tax=Periweissella fabaria TaxID=546157 RepID=A0ABN8BIM1_9LACO|nr:DNA repair protein RadA [Periweissella fabaria]MCM0597996.1 DNA repair protein RadA [Periweissella fabaria]CAH0417403.1 DNA repair protein RadA [Periweissella fabaria]
MAKIKTQFLCSNCGYISPKYLGRCPNCGEWGTLVEERIQPDTPDRKSRVSLDGEVAKVAKIGDVSTQDTPRVKVQLSELNRVLGGGVVPGSMVLIGGDPGIGKSTLLLQMSGQLAQTGGVVLYVSGEESAVQIKMRAERLGVGANDFYLYPETDMSLIRKQVDELKPNFLIIDSIQTMQEPDVQSAIGSVSQVREVTAELLQIAKTNGITVFIVGHVTKEGSIAGPKMLEHMVDTVLYFEGDLHHAYRILRAVKNRFGSTNELGIFEMQTQGLTEVANPSQIFLEERIEGATGSAIVVSMEGTRPILVEMQALITPSVFGNAQRTASGLDRNRVSLIMAVLEKRANMLLQNQDAFLKAAGGVKLDEPAIDLAVAVAVASSYQDKETQLGDAFIGEIGLTGEIRRVNRVEERVAEAEKLGFKRVFVPKNNLQGWQPTGDIEVIGVATISEALQKAFNGKSSKYRINSEQ